MHKTRIESHFDRENGLSVVHLYTPEGVFSGAACCAAEDMEYISSYFGCELAELRAWIHYYKFLIRIAHSKVEVCRHLYKTTPRDVKSSGMIKEELEKWRTTVKDLKESIHDMNEEITNLIKQRDEFIDRVYKHPMEPKPPRFQPIVLGEGSNKDNSI